MSSSSSDSQRAWLVDFFSYLFVLMIANVLWAFFTVLIITAPPALAGLFYSTNQLAHQRAVSWRTFFEGFKAYFGVSWLWGLINLLVPILINMNVKFYRQFDQTWAHVTIWFFTGLIVWWIVIQIFTFPFLIEQEKPRLRTAMTNSAVLITKKPLITVGVVVGIGLLAFLTTFYFLPAWLFLTASIITYLSNLVTIYTIKQMQTSA
jgi:uncharacterized membrane protein YesL